jgi:hypothetical protein
MVECTNFETEIEAPTEVVFDTLKDVGAWSRWTGAIKSARARSEGPWRVGYKFTMTTSIAPAPIPLTVYEFEENRLIAWGVRSPLCSILHRIRFDPLGPARCRVHHHEFVEGPLAGVVGRLFAQRIDRFDRQFAADLATYAAARGG